MSNDLATHDQQGNKLPAAAPAAVVPTPEPQANTGGDPAAQPPAAKPVQEPIKPTPVDLRTSADQQVADAVVASGIKPSQLREIMNENGGEVPLAAIKALVSVHGDAIGNQVAASLKGMYAKQQSATVTANNAIYSEVESVYAGKEGAGKELFANASEWAKGEEGLPTEQRDAISTMINSDQPYLRNMGVKLLAEAHQGSEQYTQPAQLLGGDNVAAVQATALSKKEYNMQLNAHLAKGGVYPDATTNALDARRNVGRSRGI